MNVYRMSMLKILIICNEKKLWIKFKINDIVIKKEVDVCFIWEMKYFNKECIIIEVFVYDSVSCWEKVVEIC